MRLLSTDASKFSFCDDLEQTVTNWNGIHSVPLVPLRILTGLLMIHHGSEGETNLLSNMLLAVAAVCCMTL